MKKQSVLFRPSLVRLPTLMIKLMITPLTNIFVAQSLQLIEQSMRLALKADMRSILIAIVLVERYHLNVKKFIEIVTLTLLLSLGSLPLWQCLLGQQLV